MKVTKQHIVSSYLSNLQMELIMANFRQITPTWVSDGRTDSFGRFYYMVSGEGSLKLGGKEYNPQPGQFYYIPEETHVAYTNISDNRFTKYWCHFRAKVGSHHLHELLQVPYCIEADDPVYVTKLFGGLVEAHSRSDQMTSPLKARAMLLSLMTYYLDQTADKAIVLSSSSSKATFNEILRYIEDHIAEPLTLERLGKVFNYNPNYFVRYFKSMFDMSPNQYISLARVEKAKKLLLHTDMPLQEIAEQIGLERFYFSKLFKQTTMYTPSEFRRMNR